MPEPRRRMVLKEEPGRKPRLAFEDEPPVPPPPPPPPPPQEPPKKPPQKRAVRRYANGGRVKKCSTY